MQPFLLLSSLLQNMDKNEIQQVEKCKQGDAGAQTWLYKKHAPWMLGICMRYFNDRMQAEDVVHDSFIIIYEKIGQLQRNSAIEGWIKRVVVNNCLMILKKQQHPFNIDEIDETKIENQNTNAPQNIKERILQADIPPKTVLSIINGLPAGYRTIFNLYVFENYNHNQIAQELRISEGTSKSQLLRARKMIQQRIYEWVVENEKKDEKKKVFVYSIFLCMNDDLDYIDKIAFDRLNNFRLPVAYNPPVYANSVSSVTQAVPSSAIKSFLITTAGKIAIVAVSLITGALTTWLFVWVPSNATPKATPKTNPLPVTILTDSTIYPETKKTANKTSDTIDKVLIDTTMQPNKSNQAVAKKTPPPIEKKVVYDTVTVKKIIKVKKKKIVSLSVQKTDTLP